MKSTCTTNNACDEPARAGDEPRIRRDKIQAICILEEKDVVKYERWDGFSTSRGKVQTSLRGSRRGESAKRVQTKLRICL